MKHQIIILIFIISPFLSHGHNPLSARYHLEAGDRASMLTINLSQDGINQTLLKKYNQDLLETMSQQEFEQLIVDYIKNNFRLSIGSNEIRLHKGGIKLGSHQTDLKFVLPPISDPVDKLVVDIPAFKENDDHQTIFSYKINGETAHTILSSHNDYYSTLRFSTSSPSINCWSYIMLGLFSAISMIVVVGRFTDMAPKISFLRI